MRLTKDEKSEKRQMGQRQGKARSVCSIQELVKSKKIQRMCACVCVGKEEI
jgi:hypothetical protein